MIKFSNFCGIFATVFVTTTIFLLASCSQDDDNYDSDMYTMAEMGTRLGGKGDPYNVNPPKNNYLVPSTIECPIYIGNRYKSGLDVIFIVSWSDTIRAGSEVQISYNPIINNHSQKECRTENGQTVFINEYNYLNHTIPTIISLYTGSNPYYYHSQGGYIFYEKAIIDATTNTFLGWERDSDYVQSLIIDVTPYIILK